MQKFFYTFALVLTSLFLFASAEIYSQAVQDPASINVYEASGTITVDGILERSSIGCSSSTHNV